MAKLKTNTDADSSNDYLLDPETKLKLRLDQLPEYARDGLARLQVIGSANSAAAAAHWTEHQRLANVKNDARAALDDFNRAMSLPNARPSKSDDALRGRLEKQVEKALAALLQHQESKPTMRHAPIEACLDFIRESDRRERILIDAHPDLGPVEDVLSTLGAKRAEVDKAARKARDIRMTLLSRDVALQAALDDIERVARIGAPNFVCTFSRKKLGPSADARRIQNRPAWPRTNFVTDGRGISYVDGVEAGLAFSVWLHRDELEARVRAEFAKHPNSGLTAAEIDASAAAAQEIVVRLQAEEEALVRLAEDAGLAVDRRRSDPRAVLGVDFAK